MNTIMRTLSLTLGVAVAAGCAWLTPFPTTVLAQDHSHEAVGFEGKILLKTTATATDQPLTLPQTDTPEITSMVITIQPNGHSNLHQHPVPVIAHVLEGTLETRVGGVSRTYKAGEAVAEPMNTPMQALTAASPRNSWS
ncbi:cupin domain-containing protein [Rhizobium sp. 007]|uniref:cupin domain-containing protein n=1 Tax=Rhizobium sp. 007 TaxID=2785056 RepID=UPI0018900CA8|nr:cupin domain-containing protein [Rhizobium sp. 007]QPB18462.1 cupin domain-containing protein [Rhizobium sp. 007]